MKKLKIFYPKNSLKINKPTIIMLTLVAIIVLIHFSKKIFPENFENLDLLSFAVIVITFVYFVFYLIYINFSHETENGNYSGYLIIENDKITCDNKTYLINEIEKISILEIYYRGKFNGKTLALVPKRSNGLKNYIEIHTNNKIDKYYFLQTKKENVKMLFRNELKVYYERGLIGKHNFENIMN